ncbi:hypothetical protein DMENIID0001_153750 [Sergentomyia squamirostris]
MKDEGKKGFQHFESFHNKDGDDWGYEKHEAFGYTDRKDSKDGDKEDLKQNPIVVQVEIDEKNEDHKTSEDLQENKNLEENPKNKDNESDHHVNSENVEEKKQEEEKVIVVLPENTETKDEPEEHNENHQDIKDLSEDNQKLEIDVTTEGPTEDYGNVDQSNQNIQEAPEEGTKDVEDYQSVATEDEENNNEDHQDIKKDTEQKEYEDNGDEDEDEADYKDEDTKKYARNADDDEETDSKDPKTYEVTESAEIVEGDQTQLLRFPYGFYSPLPRAALFDNPYPITPATPRSPLHTTINYGFYSPQTGQRKPQPTRPLAPTFPPKLSPLVNSRRNIGTFGYETRILHHQGNSPDKQAIQIKIYDGEITLPAGKAPKAKEEKPKTNSVEEYDDEDESQEVEDEDDSAGGEKRQNLQQNPEDDASEEDSESSEEDSGERKPSAGYQTTRNSSENRDSSEEEDSDDIQSRLVTTSDVDNDAYYWL